MVYSAIYCRKSDVITYRRFSLAGIWFYAAHSNCRFVQTVHFFSTEKMTKCVRMGRTAFKFVILGGKSVVLRSQITFYGSADALPYNEISDCKTADLPPQMTNLNVVIPSFNGRRR